MSVCLREAAVPADANTGFPALAVGCSGGPDSMALTCLLRNWSDSRSIPLTALIVDHGLRPEASEEAAQVADWLKDRGVRAVVLKHEGDRPKRNIQAEARRMRYDLMRDWCAAEGGQVLAVAHHLEDQAETFLLRLARGSGVDGLSAMAPVSGLPGDPYRNVTLIRPLLDIPRDQVRAVLEKTDWPFVSDPSNRDTRHARVRMRNLAGTLADEGLDATRLARTAQNMRRARAALESATAAFLAGHASLDPLGFASLKRTAYAAADEEIALRALSGLLRLVSGRDQPFRLGRLEDLAAGLRGNPPGPRTLGGCRVETRAGNILLCREASAIGPPAPAQRSMLWDSRFRLEIDGDFDGLTVGRLGAEGVRQARAGGLAGDLFESLPGAARAALPALWKGEALVAIPGSVGDRTGQLECPTAGFVTFEFAGMAAWSRMVRGNSTPGPSLRS
ncbi:tRNA lysidine(34) synthetase TilS [Hwanghaeella sp.]|uniref:tRNA lysidine(34) synthetase TilS n=1 Tax=Hwanghaeella sp. TaxID=2605943 RepID=UPI003CCC135F